MEFYSDRTQMILGPVAMLTQKGSMTGGSKRPMNSFAIMRQHGSILFDSPFGWTLDAIEELIGLDCAPKALVLSHRDLAGAGDAFREIIEHYELPILMHPKDQTEKVSKHSNVKFGDPTTGPGEQILRGAGIKLIHIPGHSPGSIMLYLADEGGILLAGDAAVAPGPAQSDQTPRLERPLGADSDERFIATWKNVVDTLPLTAVLPLHGACYLRRDLGDDKFERAISNIWEGAPMDPRKA